MNLTRGIATLATLAAATVSPLPAHGDDDRDAVAGVKEPKAVFDIREGNAKALLNRLNVIDETLEALIAQGLGLCAVAIRGQGTRRERVLPAVKVVGNTFISLMAWQARGYACISP